MSEKCTAGCAETHSQDITWIHGFPHGTSKDTSHDLSVCVVFLFFFSHLKLHRDPKRTRSVEVELACFNISLEVSGTHTQVSVSNKQKSEFALWLNQKRVLRFSHFCHRHSRLCESDIIHSAWQDNALDFSTLWLHSCPLRSLERLHICFRWHSNKWRLISDDDGVRAMELLLNNLRSLCVFIR